MGASHALIVWSTVIRCSVPKGALATLLSRADAFGRIMAVRDRANQTIFPTCFAKASALGGFPIASAARRAPNLIATIKPTRSFDDPQGRHVRVRAWPAGDLPAAHAVRACRRRRGSNVRHSTAAPLEIPHTTNLELDAKARKRSARPATSRSPQFLDLDAGPHAADLPEEQRRARAHPHARSCAARRWSAGSPRTSIASKKENGWCLEADPGQGEYVVFYRLHLK